MSAVVFLGKVVATDEAEASFEVLASWKGLAPGAGAVIYSHQYEGCAYSFSVDSVHLVYSYEDPDTPGGLAVDGCTRTRPQSTASSDLEALGAPQWALSSYPTSRSPAA
jgi:hypothetical protein